MKFLSSVLVLCLLLIGIERFTLPTTTAEMIDKAHTFGKTEQKAQPPREFHQDGCTLFPDKIFNNDFSLACLTHDIAYWYGGENTERKTADQQLRTEIAKAGKTGYLLQYPVYIGVRLFGDTWLTRLFEANWGYGWNE